MMTCPSITTGSSITASKWSPEFAEALEMEFCKRIPIGVPAGTVIAGTSGFTPRVDAPREENGAEESAFELASGAAACGFDATEPQPAKRTRAENGAKMYLKDRVKGTSQDSRNSIQSA